MKVLRRFALVMTIAATTACATDKSEKTERFDRNPRWDGHNNRPVAGPVTVKQDFGFSAGTSRAGGAKTGEIGGWISQAAEPAYYAKTIDTKTFDDMLEASGTFTVLRGGTVQDSAAHLLLGFFNAAAVNEWRTPNTIAIRISARGDVFHAWVEYCTSKWRAGGDTTPFPIKTDPFPSGTSPHKWSLKYDPRGGKDGGGLITAKIDGKTAKCELSADHKADGATFNRFGILNVMKSAGDANKPGGASEFYLDDLTVNGVAHHFDTDPKWDARDNRRTYQTQNIRPRFDFGYSKSNFAGGKRKGEIGGLTFRGDCRFPDRLAFYGDRIGPLTLEKPIRAAGKVALKRGVTDSAAIFGFFHSKKSIEISERQDSGAPKCFLGVSTDGPSTDGFHFSPVYRVDGDGQGPPGRTKDPLLIHPDDEPHDWVLEYDPSGAGGNGAITLSLDGKSVSVEFAKGHKDSGASFDRFGIATTWIDGNGQHIYLDDITYTASHRETK